MFVICKIWISGLISVVDQHRPEHSLSGERSDLGWQQGGAAAGQAPVWRIEPPRSSVFSNRYGNLNAFHFSLLSWQKTPLNCPKGKSSMISHWEPSNFLPSDYLLPVQWKAMTSRGYPSLTSNLLIAQWGKVACSSVWLQKCSSWDFLKFISP